MSWQTKFPKELAHASVDRLPYVWSYKTLTGARMEVYGRLTGDQVHRINAILYEETPVSPAPATT